MATTVKDHENRWILEKIRGDSQRRYTVRNKNNFITSEKHSEQMDLVMSADSVGVSANYANKIKRDETSRFVKLSVASGF